MRRRGIRFFGRGAVAALLAAQCVAGCAKANRAAVPQDILDAKIPARALESAIKNSPKPVALEPVANLDRRLVPECSGLAASRRHAGVFWTHSDSERPNTLVAIRADGTVVKPPDAPEDYRGIVVEGVKNIDWEAVTINGAGEVVIADVGNNNDRRRNLRLLVFPEPDPAAALSIVPRIVPVRHRDQRDFSPKRNKHYDCEAVFAWGGSLYFFTKRWADTWTVLCRLEMEPDDGDAGGGVSARAGANGTGGDGGGRPSTNATAAKRTRGVLVPVGAFDAQGLVTDAAVSPDGSRLAVLTYHSVWLFDLPPPPASGADPAAPDAPISGPARRIPLRFPLDQWQVEGIAFAGPARLLIGAEKGALFSLPVPK